MRCVSTPPRFSDGINPWVPKDSSGLFVDLDSSDSKSITDGGGLVSLWRDTSPNAFAFNQSSTDLKPTTRSQSFNGKNVIAFDGGDSLLNSTPSLFTPLSNGSSYLVGVVASVTAYGGIYGNTNCNVGETGAWLYAEPDGTVSHNIMGTSSVVVNKTDRGSGPKIFTLLADPDNATAADRSELYINNGSASKTNTFNITPNATDPPGKMTVGALNSFGTANFNMTGWIARIVIIVGSDATEANRLKLLSHLNYNWGVY